MLLVEDVAELRSVLRQALQLRGGFEVVAEVGDGATAIVAAARHQPDVVVLDLALPDIAGHEVLTRLRAVAPGAQVVVYTGSITPDRFPLAAQVEAYVSKDQDVGYLVDLLVTQIDAAFRRVAAFRFANTTAEKLGGDWREVSAREHEILDGMSEGKTNAEIGVALNISPFTVKNHVRRILKKLGSGNRAQACAKYSQAPQEARKAPQEARQASQEAREAQPEITQWADASPPGWLA